MPDDDNTRLTVNGDEMDSSVLDTATAALAASGPYGAKIALAIKAVAFVMEVVGWMESEASLADALQAMQRQIEANKVFLEELNARLNQLVGQAAAETNRQTLRDLMDYLDEVRSENLALLSPSLDVETAVRIANDSGITLDKFLRNDYDIWRWADVVVKKVSNPLTGETHQVKEMVPMRFKNLPTLPVYQVALLTWLAAREQVVQMGQRGRLDDDPGRIARHLAAVSVRPGFNKYQDGVLGTPQSITEQIKWHIRAFPIAATKYPANRVCKWSFDLQNWMSGERKGGDPFDILMESDNVLCTFYPHDIGAPPLEVQAETDAGVDMLYELAELLQHVADTGSVRKQFIGIFPTVEVFPPAVLYVVAHNGDLHWYRNEESSRPGGWINWQGPVRLDTDDNWSEYVKVLSGGGPGLYAMRPDGILWWYGHDGHWDGSPRLRGPVQVGTGWQGFTFIFSTGNYVIYGVRPSGEVIWYRHHGAARGDGSASAWTQQIPVDEGWTGFARVFSGGDGLIYAIREDGELLRRKHLGYKTGTREWQPWEPIAIGWNGFRDVVAAEDGVLYAFTHDGRILWCRYGERKILSSGGAGAGSAAGSGGPTSYSVVTMWEGPVEIRRGLPAYHHVFGLMPEPVRGVN